MCHAPFIAVFLLRLMDLAVISEYAVLLKVFVFLLTFFLFIRTVDGSHIVLKR